MLLNTTVSLNTRNIISNTFNFGQIMLQNASVTNNLLTVSHNNEFSLFSSIAFNDEKFKPSVTFQFFYQNKKNLDQLSLYYLTAYFKKNKFSKKLRKRLKYFNMNVSKRVLFIVKKSFLLIKTTKKKIIKKFSFYFFFRYFLITYLKSCLFLNYNNFFLRLFLLKLFSHKKFSYNSNNLAKCIYELLNFKFKRGYKKRNLFYTKKIRKNFRKLKLYFIKFFLKYYLLKKQYNFYKKYISFLKEFYSQPNIFSLNFKYIFKTVYSFYEERFLLRNFNRLMLNNTDITVGTNFTLKTYFFKIALLFVLSKKII